MTLRVLLMTFLTLAVATPGLAETTTVTVRIIARDAKFIGTSMGGVRVTLRDATHGKILAQGLTEGGTGDTPRIMQAQGRNPDRAGEGVAAFKATLDLAAPTLVDLTAEGPIGHPGSALKVTQQRWIMPGQNVTEGDGWVVELPGLVITPQAKAADGKLAVSAKVELMCGCPITPGGLWDAADYETTASLWKGGKQVAESKLAFLTAPGGYGGSIALPDKGPYRLMIFARNIRTGNSGLTQVDVGSD